MILIHIISADILLHADKPEIITNRTYIVWNDLQYPCADTRKINYIVDIVRLNDSEPVYMKTLIDNEVNISDLEINQEYTVYVTPVVSDVRCVGDTASRNFTVYSAGAEGSTGKQYMHEQ